MLIGNTVLNPTGININYVSKYITFDIILNVYFPFFISCNNGYAIRRRVMLLEDVILASGETRLVKAKWKPLPEGIMFLLQVNHQAVVNALVNSEIKYIKIINLSD